MKFGRLDAVLSALVIALFSGCGGGGGGGNSGGDDGGGTNPALLAPAAPALALAVQANKTFQFTWSDVADETQYRLMESADGTAAFTQVATIAANAASYDLIVPLYKRVNAKYQLQACNAAGCNTSAEVAVTGALTQAVGYLKASNAESGDELGGSATYYIYQSMALSADGSTLAVGAFGEDSSATGINGNQADNSASSSGAVYVFTRSGSTWTQQAYIKPSNTQQTDLFGVSVALSADGHTLAVGSLYEDSRATGVNGNQADNSAPTSGAAYVFTRDGGTWTQHAYIKASNTEADDQFGKSIALSADGDTLAVGSVLEDSSATGVNDSVIDNAAENSGAVYVYIRNGGAWAHQAYIKASNTGNLDQFGESVALSADGNTLAVGALFEDSNATGINGNQADNSASSSGAAYVFTRSGGTWTQQAYIKASDAEAGDLFGTTVALSADGSTLAVSAWDEDSSATGVNGNQADNSATDSGAAYVFTRSGGTWTQQAYIKASNTQTGDRFGRNLSLSADGSTLAVGAWEEDSIARGLNGNQNDNSWGGSGAAYVFIRSGGAWAQETYVKASDTEIGDRFGATVALSGDGNTLAVGAPNEDNIANESGAVYVY
jgi:hypothetical protein